MMVAVVWEIFEFTYDHLAGEYSQHWKFRPEYPNFELLKTIPERYALLDTMSDLICGTIGAAIGFILIYWYARKMNNLADQKEKEKVELAQPANQLAWQQEADENFICN